MEVHEPFDNMEHPLPSPFKVPSMSSTPLQQVSPERLNQRIPHSPSLPITFDPNSRKAQHRLSDASDVKARIAMLNSMSQNGSPVRSTSPTKSHQSSSSSQAAVQRAVLGREEAESALNAMMAQLESAKARERLVAERVESLMEQLTESRSRQRHERQVYEKEVKNSKKTEYRAELAVIKLQEELREVKSEFESVKARVEHHKAEKEKARQEAFERAYAVAGMTEELHTLKERLKMMEQERDNAVAMAASKIALEEKRAADAISENNLASQSITKEAAMMKQGSPIPALIETSHKVLLALDDMDVDLDSCSIEIRYEALQREVTQLRRQRHEDQELIHFTNMQCQFQVCPCRVAERDGMRFVQDYEYDDKLRASSAKRRKIADDKPAPRLMSWKQKLEMKKMKRSALGANIISEGPGIQTTDAHMTSRDNEEPLQKTVQQDEQIEQVVPLPPVEVSMNETELAEHVAEVEVAAQIALPSPASTPNHTAHLEEFTQVIVETATSSQPFAFSTSVSSKHLADTRPTLHQSKSSIDLPDDLFDLSPPKHIIPRPSTVMGVLTVTSPVRLVPDSPYYNLTSTDEGDTVPEPCTTRIALNDTSGTRSPRTHQRSQSRVAMRNQSRGRSPAVHQLSQSDTDMVRPASALDVTSPSSTIFPITPVMKNTHARSKSQTQPRMHRAQPQQYDDKSYHTTTESTMTTRVPLRDESELFLPPAPDSIEQINTTTLAIKDSSLTSLKDPLANIPGTPITREAALAQIRARRDRARSLNMRINRGSEESSQTDAGEMREAKTPGSVARRGIKIGLDLGAKLGIAGGESGRGRDVSHASAPGRF